MPYFASNASLAPQRVSRPMVMGLFVASCLLSIVSWYTTEQGMALYLSTWFAVLASLGIQAALVLVAWLIGFTQSKRALLVAVYVITAVVSIAFSYVSLYTWFSARERPAMVQRKLYATLNEATGQTQKLLEGAVSEGQKHVLALEEMTAAEKAHGYISRAQDADPYLAWVREAVAREAQTYSNSYAEGTGAGLRYTAFDRYAKLTRQSLGRMQQALESLTEFRAQLKPLDSTENQLRAFRQVYDAIPWQEVEQALHSPKFAPPPAPVYTDFVDQTVTGQEDLMLAFQDLLAAPTNRHLFALALAAFIDIVVFLLAYASGPYFFGAPEQRWISAGAALDGIDDPLFVRDFLRKLTPGTRGTARVEASALTTGEQQLCLLLASKGRAALAQQEGRSFYLLDQELHQYLLESLVTQSLPLHASAQRPAIEA